MVHNISITDAQYVLYKREAEEKIALNVKENDSLLTSLIELGLDLILKDNLAEEGKIEGVAESK